MLSETRHVWGTSRISIVIFPPGPSRHLSLKAPYSNDPICYSPMASLQSQAAQALSFPLLFPLLF